MNSKGAGLNLNNGKAKLTATIVATICSATVLVAAVGGLINFGRLAGKVETLEKEEERLREDLKTSEDKRSRLESEMTTMRLGLENELGRLRAELEYLKCDFYDRAFDFASSQCTAAPAPSGQARKSN